MAKKTTTIEPYDLGIEALDGHFQLTLGGTPVLDPIGKMPVVHVAPGLLEHMINEFMMFPMLSVDTSGVVTEPTFIGSYRLSGFQRRWIDTGEDNYTQEFQHLLVHDNFFRPVPGPERVDQIALWQPVDSWLARMGAPRFDADFVEDGTCEAAYGVDVAQMDAYRQSAEVLESVFSRLDPEEKAAAVYLANAYGLSIVPALALVTGEVSEHQFAQAVIGSERLMAVYPDMESEEYVGVMRDMSSAARASLDYIAAYRRGTAVERLIAVLEGGKESGTVEFKSSLRWDLREARKSKEITHAVVKTIAGFLNTQGGTLVIGVDDDGKMLGIEIDKFESADKFERHLYTALTNAMGASAAPFVNVSMLKHAGKSIALVECTRASTPLLVSSGSEEGVFYVRTGPATISLPREQMEEWKSVHWN